MLELIILGEIPGTSAKIEFLHVAAILIAVASAAAALYTPKLKWNPDYKKFINKYFEKISI